MEPLNLAMYEALPEFLKEECQIHPGVHDVIYRHLHFIKDITLTDILTDVCKILINQNRELNRNLLKVYENAKYPTLTLNADTFINN